MLFWQLQFAAPPNAATAATLNSLNQEIWENGAVAPGLTLNPNSGNLRFTLRTPTLRAALYAALLIAVSVRNGEIMIDATTTSGAEAEARVIDTRRQVEAEKIARAHADIEQEDLSLREAARRHKIKPSTLSDRRRRVRKPTIPDTPPPGRAKKRDVDSKE
jgi:hypothetical protein